MPPLLSRDAIPTGRKLRIKSCGRPLTGWTCSGKKFEFSYNCRDRFCGRCAPKYARRAFAKISTKLGGEPAYMATITRVAPEGLSRGLLREAIFRERQHWKTTTKRLRWDDYRAKRLDETGDPDYAADLRTEGLDPPDDPNLATCSSCEFWSSNCQNCSDSIGIEYDSATGYWPTADGSRTYLWALEITTGAEGDRWHVHRHVLTPTRSQAERVLAAAYTHRDREQLKTGIGYRVDLRELTAENAAGYAAGYLSGLDQKKGGWESAVRDLSPEIQATYLLETTGLRRYDAAGDWRPLGMSPDETDDPLALVADSRAVYDAETYYRSGAIDDQMVGKSPREHRACTDCEQTAWTNQLNFEPETLEAAYIDDRSIRLPRPRARDGPLGDAQPLDSEFVSWMRLHHRFGTCTSGTDVDGAPIWRATSVPADGGACIARRRWAHVDATSRTTPPAAAKLYELGAAPFDIHGEAAARILEKCGKQSDD